MRIVETIELISINGTLIFQLISFLIFLFLINRIMLRPLRRQTGERQAQMDLIAEDITAANTACDDLNHQMKLQEDEVRQTASAMRDELEAAGKQAAAALIKTAREEISELMARAQKDNEAKIGAIRKELNSEAENIAQQMMVSILGRRIES